MNQIDFIAQKALLMREGKHGRHSSCSAVVYDGDIVYSYGYHYPLLWPIEKDGKVFLVVNAKGYSMTTAKHIAYACRVADVVVHSTNTLKTWKGTIAQIQHEICIDRDAIAAIKRKGTKKEAMLAEDIKRKEDYLRVLGSDSVGI